MRIDEPGYFERSGKVEADPLRSRSMWRVAAAWLAGAIRGRRGLSALDVGCGSGLTLARLALMPEVGRVVGLEPSPEALRQARGRGPFPLVRGSATKLPFASDSFDAVTCLDVFQHLADGDDRRAASEIARVLRPGGVLLVRSNSAGMGSGLAELVAVAADAGLLVERSSYVHCLPAQAREARGRLARGSRPRSRSAWLSHPSGGGLRIDVPDPSINRMMGRVAVVEERATVGPGVTLPSGHSTMILARRADGTASGPGQGRGRP